MRSGDLDHVGADISDLHVKDVGGAGAAAAAAVGASASAGAEGDAAAGAPA